MAGEKDLAMLTIDGVSMRNVFTDKDIGKYQRQATSVSVPNPNSWRAVGDPITIPSDGYYLIYPRYIAQGTSTGSSIRYVSAMKGGGTGTDTLGSVLSYYLPGNVNSTTGVINVVFLNEGDALYVAALCPSVTITYTVIEAIKLPAYPGIEE